MILTTIGWHHLHCGCIEDEGYGLKACPTHALALTLRDAAELVRLKGQDDLAAHEFLVAVLERLDALERNERHVVPR